MKRQFEILIRYVILVAKNLKSKISYGTFCTA